MTNVVDSYRFIDRITKRLVKSWINLEGPREMPWTSLPKALSDCTVALVSSAGIALQTDRPFDQEKERQNPWSGDPTYRIIPQMTKTEDIRVYHLHIDPSLAETDINCSLPIERLAELVEMGQVGRAARSHYSFMGYILEPTELLETSIPEIVEHLKEDQVDVVVLIPA